MSEKHLTELAWKTLATKQKVKDPGLGKALAELGNCADADPERTLKALAAVEKHAETLKKENLKNEDLKEHLVELLKEVDKQRKTLELLKKGAAKKGAQPEDEGAEAEDEEGGDLKSKLIGGMKKVKQRKPDDPPVEVMVCKAGSAFAALLAKKVGATQKTQLQDVFKGETGLKFVKGTCELGKMDVYTFILESLPSGAAKGLKAFFKEQTQITYKIQVRDASGAVEEDLAGEEAGKSPPSAPPPAPDLDDGAVFNKRLQALTAKIKEAIAAAGPAAKEIKDKVAEAGANAKKKSFADANRSLDQVEALLGSSGKAGEKEGAEQESEEPGQDPKWVKALEAIEPRYLAALSGQPANASKLRAVMAHATGKAEAGDTAGGIQGLKALEPLLKEAESSLAGKETDVIPGGIVSQRRAQFTAARLRWVAGVDAVNTEIAKVQAAIAGLDAEAAMALEGFLNSFRDKLLKILDTAKKASDEATADKALQAAIVATEALKKEVAANPILKHLQSFPGGSLKIQDSFAGTFAEVTQLLKAA